MTCLQNPTLDRQHRRGMLDAAREHWREKHRGKLAAAYQQAVADADQIRRDREHLPLSIRRIDPKLHRAEGRVEGIGALQEARRRDTTDGRIATWVTRLELWVEDGRGPRPEPWTHDEPTQATAEGGSGASYRRPYQGIDPPVRVS